MKILINVSTQKLSMKLCLFTGKQWILLQIVGAHKNYSCKRKFSFHEWLTWSPRVTRKTFQVDLVETMLDSGTEMGRSVSSIFIPLQQPIDWWQFESCTVHHKSLYKKILPWLLKSIKHKDVEHTTSVHLERVNEFGRKRQARVFITL